MLDKILANKKYEIEEIPEILPKRTKDIIEPLQTLKNKPFIAEVKKASPSAGEIKPDASPAEQAALYEKYGAGAVSVLTDKYFFKGSFEYLKEVSEKINIPVLCKDFIISERQIEAAYAFGADIILIIAAVLTQEEIGRLSEKARELNLYILYEIHTAEEYEKIKDFSPALVGVNSRNLDTLEIDKQKGAQILNTLPDSLFKIAESGINSPEDVANFRRAGADAFLIGTYLMKSDNIKKSFQNLYRGLE
ncbi:indole-3-glycerol phosphate synthase TrpC [Flexistipes sinusarabici]|uniref:indole-3-glycerol phosphate synthase TrpC n=1 Tax=Flexistipes sinusarabici TaxID=2352 RepID=UPI0023542554|nr:indole-3-glycerol phosphate synthase TrpC [Flexistipes sinusarabici]